MDRDQTLSAGSVRRMIASGKHIVISEGRVLQLDGWLDKHPGGKLAIQHMVGKDATNEINMYVRRERNDPEQRARILFMSESILFDRHFHGTILPAILNPVFMHGGFADKLTHS